MGRIFETRKATMFKRWDRMAKAFTRIGKDIAIAVKSGGPSPDTNPSLRRVLQNARAANMPKDKIENAIKKASGQGAENYDIVMYEGYAAHGMAVMVGTGTNKVGGPGPRGASPSSSSAWAGFASRPTGWPARTRRRWSWTSSTMASKRSGRA